MRWLAVVVTLRPNASRPRACMDSESAVSETVPSLDMVEGPRQKHGYEQGLDEDEDEDEEELDWTEQKLFKSGL